MWGAVCGDVIGSYYEVHCTKEYDFPLVRESTFTDDSVLIAAVCRAILEDPRPVGRFLWGSGHGSTPLNTAGSIPSFLTRGLEICSPTGRKTAAGKPCGATATAEPCG